MGRVLAVWLLASVPAIAAVGLVGVRLAGASDRGPDGPPAAATTKQEKTEGLDLGAEARALVPRQFRLHGRQNTLERSCFVGDGERLEPCVEFTTDGPGVVGDRRRELEQQAELSGWRIVGFAEGPQGPTLTLARGSLRARVVFGPAGVTPTAFASNEVRVWDPSRRRPIAAPVGAKPTGDPAARRPFVAAANAACDRFDRRLRVLEDGAKREPDEVLAVFARGWRRLVADIAALDPPQADAPAARSLVRELRRFPRVLAYFRAAEGEEGLAAVAGLLQQGQRVEKAFRQIGLRRCRGLTGVPPGQF